MYQVTVLCRAPDRLVDPGLVVAANMVGVPAPPEAPAAAAGEDTDATSPTDDGSVVSSISVGNTNGIERC